MTSQRQPPTRGAVAEPPAIARTYGSSGSRGTSVSAVPSGIARNVVVAVVDSGRELDAVALRLPPLDAAQNLGAGVLRTRGRRDADRAAGRQRPGEESGLHGAFLPCGRSPGLGVGSGNTSPRAAAAIPCRRRSSSARAAARWAS